MNAVLYLFGGGAAFFVGAGVVLAGVLASARGRRGATLLAAVGVVVVALSAAPLPAWLYATVGAATVAWRVAERRGRWRRAARLAVAAAWLGAVAAELPWHVTPAVPRVPGRPPLAVIGDSLSAGVGGAGEETWPRRIAREHGVAVADLSRVGATAASAAGQAERVPADAGVVLVEVGGNDLLGPTSAADFDRDLSDLLARVCRPGRVVVMLELPLPPSGNGFGRAQRRLAGEYEVVLVPRRVLMGVLTSDGATSDGLHLTPTGHARLAAAVWAVVGPAYRD